MSTDTELTHQKLRKLVTEEIDSIPDEETRTFLKKHIFSFNGDDGSEYHWNITDAVAAINCKPQKLIPEERVRIPIDEGLYTHVTTFNGVEEEHLSTITPERLEEPILVIVFKDGSYIVADGNHRITKAFRMGVQYLPAYIVTKEAMEPYEVSAEQWQQAFDILLQSIAKKVRG